MHWKLGNPPPKLRFRGIRNSATGVYWMQIIVKARVLRINQSNESLWATSHDGNTVQRYETVEKSTLFLNLRERWSSVRTEKVELDWIQTYSFIISSAIKRSLGFTSTIPVGFLVMKSYRLLINKKPPFTVSSWLSLAIRLQKILSQHSLPSIVCCSS